VAYSPAADTPQQLHLKSRPALATLFLPTTESRRPPTADRLCPGTDSNRDALRHHPLKMACLPISPPGPTILHVRRASLSAIGVQNSQIQKLVTCDNRQLSNTGATGFEPATSRVTVECSNQTELRPLRQSSAAADPLPERTRYAPTTPFFPSDLHTLSQVARRGIEPLSAP
jgi:hypothetical protein